MRLNHPASSGHNRSIALGPSTRGSADPEGYDNAEVHARVPRGGGAAGDARKGWRRRPRMARKCRSTPASWKGSTTRSKFSNKWPMAPETTPASSLKVRADFLGSSPRIPDEPNTSLLCRGGDAGSGALAWRYDRGNDGVGDKSHAITPHTETRGRHGDSHPAD